jgi:hypothetical protein
LNKTQIKRHIVNERPYSIQVLSLAGETPAYVERELEWMCTQLFPLWLSQQSMEHKSDKERSKIWGEQRATKVQQSIEKSYWLRGERGKNVVMKTFPLSKIRRKGASPRESLNAKNTNAALFVWIARGNDISQSSRFVTEDVHHEWHDRE